MKANAVRNWLTAYFLTLTVILGAYVLLLSQTMLLPISKQEGTDAIEIIIPVLIGQLTIMFQWFAAPPPAKDTTVPIAPWLVKAPPILVTIILVLAIVMLVVGNLGEGSAWAPSPGVFKAVVTFSVTILNATTFLIIARYFRSVT